MKPVERPRPVRAGAPGEWAAPGAGDPRRDGRVRAPRDHGTVVAGVGVMEKSPVDVWAYLALLAAVGAGRLLEMRLSRLSPAAVAGARIPARARARLRA